MSFLKWVSGGVPSGKTHDSNFFLGWKLLQLQKLKDLVRDRDPSHLTKAFLWRATPQGHNYWEVRHYGVEPMSEEDWGLVSSFLSFCENCGLPDYTWVE